jgi:predicted MFS family arabinose efflux permease
MVLVYAIVKAQEFGWGSGRTLGLLGASAVLLAAFVAIELRSKAPLIRLDIFRQRALSAANVAMMFVAAGMFSMFFFASLYVQDILGYSPLKAGLAFLPITAGIIVGAGVAQGVIKRFGPRAVASSGVLLATAGMLVLTGLPVHGSYVSDLLVGLFPMSVGMGLTFVPVTLLATAGVAAEDSGLASGLLNTSQQIGGAIGLAVLSTLSASRTTSLLTDGAARPEALVGGWHVAFTGGAILLGSAALTLVVALRRRHLAHVDLDAALPVAA